MAEATTTGAEVTNGSAADSRPGLTNGVLAACVAPALSLASFIVMPLLWHYPLIKTKVAQIQAAISARQPRESVAPRTA